MARPAEDNVGDTVVLIFEFGESVTGSTWLCQWRKFPDAPVDVTVSIDATQAATGRIVGTVSAAQTLALGPGRWFFDLQRTAAGVVSTWPKKQQIIMTQDISHT